MMYILLLPIQKGGNHSVSFPESHNQHVVKLWHKTWSDRKPQALPIKMCLALHCKSPPSTSLLTFKTPFIAFLFKAMKRMCSTNHSTNLPNLHEVSAQCHTLCPLLATEMNTITALKGLTIQAAERASRQDNGILFCFVKATWCLAIVHHWLLSELQWTEAWTEACKQI